MQTPNANILIDAGFGYRATVQRLAMCGLTVQDISAIVVTHEHSDHVYALPQFAKYSRAMVFVPYPALNFVAQQCFCSNIQGVNGPFLIADVRVDVYQCAHDARACFGYRFTTDDDCVASVTDTGFAAQELTQFLAPCRAIMLESNHDVAMLENGFYPYFLKQRISSSVGHLSNDQCAEVLKSLVGTNVQSVVLAHLSQQNNLAELAMETAVRALSGKGIVVGKDMLLYVADQYKNEVTL